MIRTRNDSGRKPAPPGRPGPPVFSSLSHSSLISPFSSLRASFVSARAKSVIVSEVTNGKELRWKNLDQVWHLLDDAPGFQAYVEKEVRSFLGEA